MKSLNAALGVLADLPGRLGTLVTSSWGVVGASLTAVSSSVNRLSRFSRLTGKNSPCLSGQVK